MKKLSVLASLMAVAAIVPVCALAEAPAAAPGPTPKDKLAYALGANIGKNMKETRVELDLASFAQGVNDAMAGGTLAMSDAELKAAMDEFQRVASEKRAQHMKELGIANAAEGEKFLAENKAREGVVTLPSGLQYQVIKEGDGALPKSTDKVTVQYRGTLVNGTEFDSSIKRGKPSDFSLAPDGGLIKGMIEAMLAMKAGSKWTIYIPSALAYGERGRPPSIGPNSTLIFEVELLGIKEAPPTPPAK